MKEYIRQPREQAPKYAAVLDFIAAHPPVDPKPSSPKPAQNPLVIAPRNPEEPVIVWRPAIDPERVFVIENPSTLDLLLEGTAWDKRNLFGKWQGRWDNDSLFLSVRSTIASVWRIRIIQKMMIRWGFSSTRTIVAIVR